MPLLSARHPLEATDRAVGRRTLRLLDHDRADRPVVVDVWYPAAAGEQLAPRTQYEPIPGIAFESANAHVDAPFAAGRYPLIVLSHGRTGMRFAYAMLCEALAARGAIVAAPDHAGDVMTDWLGGTFADDRTNEVNRVGDSAFVLDVLLGVRADHDVDPQLLGAVDASRIASVGHSYGAYTALAAAAGVRGVAPDSRIGAVIGLQPYTRSMSDNALARVHTPTLLVLSEFDTTAPIATDGDRPWSLVPAEPCWRLDLLGSAHHASSDMGLYLELAASIPDLPPMVAAYVTMMTPDMVGEHLRPWRDGVLIQVCAIWSFLDIVLGMNPDRGRLEADRLAATHGLILQRR